MIYDSVLEIFSGRLLQALLTQLEISLQNKNTLILKELCVDYNMNYSDFVLSDTLKPLACFCFGLEDTSFEQCVICLALEPSSKTAFPKREMMVHVCVSVSPDEHLFLAQHAHLTLLERQNGTPKYQP